MPAAVFLLAQDQPAGGAAIGEVVLATGMAMVATAVLLVLGIGHRSGRLALLGRWADFAERTSGLPGWAALPSGIATGSLIIAVFGMYWDIALHIGVGRDEGLLANPAHYFILIGLFGIFSAGFIAMVLPKERPGPTALRLGRDWYAPLGGVLVCACGAFALIGFPLDDIWHRLFGQDVTLWGPTHLMLIGGASMTLVGMAVLLVEGLRSQGGEKGWAGTARAVALTGGFMLGLSTFQAEFDFGVPQFRFVFQPLLIMIAAGVGLVAARIWGGPGSALGAVGFFLLIRGLLAVAIGPVFGETTPHMPLYLAEAIVVELVALRVATEKPLAFGLWSGLAIGTVGLAAEWGWSHLWLPLPWPSELFPEARCSASPVRWRALPSGPGSAPGSASSRSRPAPGPCRRGDRSRCDRCRRRLLALQAPRRGHGRRDAHGRPGRRSACRERRGDGAPGGRGGRRRVAQHHRLAG